MCYIHIAFAKRGSGEMWGSLLPPELEQEGERTAFLFPNLEKTEAHPVGQINGPLATSGTSGLNTEYIAR